jgi:hypothetical protein
MSRISLPLELRVVNLCYDLFEAGADRGRSARGGFDFAVGSDESLKFMRDAVLSLSHRATRANALTCETTWRATILEGLTQLR